MSALLSSGLMEVPDPRLQCRLQSWPMAFVVHLVKDECQFGSEVDQVDEVVLDSREASEPAHVSQDLGPEVGLRARAESSSCRCCVA